MLRIAFLIAIGAVAAEQLIAAETVARMRWLSSPPCGSMRIEHERPNQSIHENILVDVIAELPAGRERKIAQEILSEIGGTRLHAFCRDPHTDEYVANLPQSRGHSSSTLRVVLGNRSQPRIEADVGAVSGKGSFQYMYRVYNESHAKAPIMTWGLLIPAVDRANKMMHPTWQVLPPMQESRRTIKTSQDLGSHHVKSANNLSRWRTSSEKLAIQAGSSMSLFSITSSFRPGWTIAYVGSDDGIEIPERPIPEEVEAGLYLLSRPEHYYSSVLTIGPKFGPDMDRTGIAGDWNLGIQMMITAGVLSIDSRYVSALLNSLSRIAAAEVRIEFEVDTEPLDDTEARIGTIVQMALH